MIRPYKISDRDCLNDIFKLNVPKYFAVKELNDFREYLKNNSHNYFIIEYEGKIVGGVGYCVKESNKSGSINWIFLHPNYFGIGLGKKAVKHCHNLLSQGERVEKYVVTTSQHAYSFFEKFGYKTVRTEKDYWGKGLDLYEMYKIKRFGVE